MISLSVSRRTLLAAAAAAGFVMTPLAKAVAAAVDVRYLPLVRLRD